MTVPLSLDLTARVAKLLPRLGSDQNGEVAATAAAIQRTLKAAGCDLHDLAAHVAEGPKTVVVYRERPAAAQSLRDFDYGGWRRSYQGFDHRRCNRAQAAKVRAAPPGFLSAWESEFVGSLARQLDQGRNLTPRQETILRDIHSRYEERYG